MVAKIVIPFLAISTTLLGAGSADAAAMLQSAEAAQVETSDKAVTVQQVKEPGLLEGSTLAFRLQEFDTARSNSLAQEMFLGSGDLGKTDTRIGGDARYKDGANKFSLSLQGGTLSAMLNGSTLAIKDVFSFAGMKAAQPLNTLRIGITDGVKDGVQFSLDNLVLWGSDLRGNQLDPVKLGSLNGVDFGGTTQWDITGLDFGHDFELQGTLGILADKGRMRSAGDFNRVDFAMGNAAEMSGGVSPVPEVSSWVMMITGFAFVGTALRGNRRKSLAQLPEAEPA